MTISFNMSDVLQGTPYHAIFSGYFVARRAGPDFPACLYFKTGDSKLYCLGRPGDANRVPVEVFEAEKNKQYFGYRQVDLDITVRPA